MGKEGSMLIANSQREKH